MTPPVGHDRRRIVRNSGFILLSRVIDVVVTLGITPIVARYLGLEMFAFFAVISAVSMVLSPLADFGFERIVCREIAGDRSKADGYLNTAMVVRLCISILIVAGTLVTAKYWLVWNNSIKLALVVSIASELVWAAGMTYIAVIRAFERMEYELLANFLFKLSWIVFICMAVYSDKGLVGVFMARLASAGIFLFLAAWFFYRKFGQLKFNPSRSTAWFILKESYPLAAASVLLALIFRVDVFLLTSLSSKVDVALFEAPHRLITQLQIFAVAISLGLFPVMARVHAAGSMDELRRLYNSVHKFLIITGVGLSAILCALSKPIVLLLFGHAFGEAAISCRMLAPTMVCLFVLSLQNLYLTAIGRQSLNTLSIFIALVINVLLGIAVIPRFGYVGASGGTMIAYLALTFISGLFVTRSGMTIDHWPAILKTICAGVVVYLAGAFVNMHSPFMTIVTGGLCSLIAYVVCIFAFRILSPADIAGMKAILRTRRMQPECQSET
jgi:O-antigen/teichoic acid export membrane protein